MAQRSLRITWFRASPVDTVCEMKIIRVAALAVPSHNSLWFVALVSLMNVSSIASIAGDSGAVPVDAGVDVFNPVSDSLWRKSTTGWTHRYRCLSDCTVEYFYYVSASFRLPRCGSIS